MMKKCNLLGTVTFMVTLILLASCKKENNKAQTCGIVKESYVNGNDTIVWNYTYDVNGKLYKTDMGGGSYFNRTYTSTMVTLKYYEANALKYGSDQDQDTQGKQG